MAYHVNEDDRRPIAARRAAWAHLVARAMAKRKVSPNAISVVGVLFAVAGGIALAVTPHVGDMLARVLLVGGAVMAVARLLANLFDGMVAVERGVASPVGELYNDVPDRVSDVALMVGAGYAVSGEPAAGWAAAVAAVFVAYVRACGKAGGAPQVFAGPMAKPQRMWLLVAVCIVTALLPIDLRSTSIGGHDVGVLEAMLWLVVVGCLVTAVRRLRMIGAALREASP